MITSSMVYWITRLDDIKCLFGLGGFTAACLLLFVVCFCVDNYYTKTALGFCVGVVFCLLLCVGSVFIPSTKDAIVIYAAPIILNNEEVQEMPLNAVKVCNEWFKEQLGDIGGEVVVEEK